MTQTPSREQAHPAPSHHAPPRSGRTRHTPPIPPEACLVRHCPICAWRRAGLLDWTGPRLTYDGEPEAKGYVPVPPEERYELPAR